MNRARANLAALSKLSIAASHSPNVVAMYPKLKRALISALGSATVRASAIERW
jgi:hypothetical protein